MGTSSRSPGPFTAYQRRIYIDLGYLVATGPSSPVSRKSGSIKITWSNTTFSYSDGYLEGPAIYPLDVGRCAIPTTPRHSGACRTPHWRRASIPELNGRFLARKILEANGRLSSKPSLTTESLWCLWLGMFPKMEVSPNRPFKKGDVPWLKNPNHLSIYFWGHTHTHTPKKKQNILCSPSLDTPNLLQGLWTSSLSLVPRRRSMAQWLWW